MKKTRFRLECDKTGSIRQTRPRGGGKLVSLRQAGDLFKLKEILSHALSQSKVRIPVLYLKCDVDPSFIAILATVVRVSTNVMAKRKKMETIIF